MQIKKVSGPGDITPGSSIDSKKKAAAAGFDKTLNKAVEEAKKAAKSDSAEETMDPEKLKVIKNRIESGYYNRPDIVSDIADKLLGGEKS